MGEKELSIQALRDQRTIVSILAIEQLTGVAYPPRTAISATAKADTGDTALKIQENLEKAEKDQAGKQKAFEKASEDFEDLENKSNEASKKHEKTKKELGEAQDALTKDPQNAALKEKVERLKTDEGEQKTKSEEAKTKADEKKKEKVAAEKALNDQKKVVSSFKKKLESALAVSVDSTTEIKFSDCNECNDKKPSPESIKILADAVERIVEQTFKLDEIQLKCLKTLEAPDPVAMQRDPDSYKGARSFCLAYMKNTNEKTRLDLLEREKAIKELENIDFGTPKPKNSNGGQ
ncbi:MAG: hypothetical protein EP347_12985 [Alphaproteobacteria bacterium]|nr:MAG: hypothetical protein EP347_12985 [Alphaproteobacteria bacterium]